MIYAARSVTGKRANNEDSVYVPKYGEISLAVVADGMGGHSAGNVASAMAVETVAAELKKGGAGSPSTLVKSAVNRANTAVYDYARAHSECRGMGTTLVLALVFKTRFVAANVGDSRLYHYHAGKLTQITADHSYVAELLASGYITKEEALRHPRRNLITRALGTRASEKADVFECAWEENDILLLCSDGLYSELEDKALLEMIEKYKNIEDACDALVRLALDAGSTDNVSAVLVKNGEVW
ncbi:MAG: Stp1/IreP family PP2C-type Ser/Thr phosphatase [Clostridiales bacterium]|nr:Stp1/IreP family PP2C-type Ser/Thr phosphatase [Clostridiales bacterium]